MPPNGGFEAHYGTSSLRVWGQQVILFLTYCFALALLGMWLASNRQQNNLEHAHQQQAFVLNMREIRDTIAVMRSAIDNQAARASVLAEIQRQTLVNAQERTKILHTQLLLDKLKFLPESERAHVRARYPDLFSIGGSTLPERPLQGGDDD